jgi:hypothetical protein
MRKAITAPPTFKFSIEKPADDAYSRVIVEFEFDGWFVNRLGDKFVNRYSVELEYFFEADGDADDEGRPVDCSYWDCRFKNVGVSTAQAFFKSVFGKLDFSAMSPSGPEELIEELTERFNETVKLYKPITKAVNTKQPTLKVPRSSFEKWNPDHKTKKRVAGYNVSLWREGRPGSSTNDCSCAELLSAKKLSKAEIELIEKNTGVQNGNCISVSAPRIEQVENKFRYYWHYNHGTD